MDAVHLGAQAHVLQDPGGEGLVAELAQLAHHLDGLGARRCRERAQVPLGVLDLPATSKRAAPFRFASAMACLQLEDLHHHGVGVREEQPHLREEPPHVEVVGLLHHELGELQRAGADLGGHAHAGLAAVRLERLHEGQEPLQVVDLELEVRHGALAHGPLELGRLHVGVRVPELVGVHAAAAEDGVLGELHHLLGDHAPHRLELPPLAVLELHEGAAGEAVGPVQPPDPGAHHVPQELEPLAVHALLHVHAEEGHELLAGRGGEAEALRHVRGAHPVQALPDLHARGGSPVQVVVQLGGKS